jgi:hypothetical protein
MTPLEKGRFCGSCQKQVVDFSNMSDREIAMFFKKPSTGSVCGRFMGDQLDRDIEIPGKRIPWVKYFFQFLLPGFLISCRVQAQGKVKIIEKTQIVNSTCNNEIVGKLVSEQTSMRKNKTIRSKNEKKKMILLPAIPTPGPVERTLIETEKNNIIPPSMRIEQSLVGYVGGLIVRRYPVKKVARPIQLVKKIFKDTSFEKFKVFPNPVKSNSNLTIEWKQTETGYYVLQLLNQSGQLVFAKEMYIDNEARLLSIDLPSTPAGNYFLRMTNKVSGKSYTEKIIVQ